MDSESQTLTEAEPHHMRNAVRSIKVALLLSRLKVPPSSTAAERRASAAATEKEKELERVIGDLKMAVVRERLRSKRIRLCGLFETFLEVALVFVLLETMTINHMFWGE